MTSGRKNTTEKSVDMKKNIELTGIDPRPGGVKLTPVEFIRVFNFFQAKYSLEMNDAYDVTVEYCIERQFSLTFSTFVSFKKSYYNQIKRECFKRGK